MKKIFLHTVFQFLFFAAVAQPYVDPFQIRFTRGFRSQSESRGTPFNHVWAGSDIPVKLKMNTYLLLSPYFENWRIDSASQHHIFSNVKGAVFPVGLLMPLKNPKWSLALSAIIRSNAEQLFAAKTFQAGGVGFLSYEKSPGKKWRFGVYINSEFSGFFVMPLLGADWRINTRNYLFGLLPGRLTWEHQFTRRFFGGFTFRAITNSYRFQNGQYLRIDDNQLSAFLDIYPAKQFCITLEPGYGIMRKLRTGVTEKKYLSTEKWGDGLFLKLSAAYRIRLPEHKPAK